MDLDFIQSLLDTPQESAEDIEKVINELYPVQPQTGPLRYYDTEMRCLSRRCGSPTHYKLNNVPKCETHCLKEMNEMLTNA